MKVSVSTKDENQAAKQVKINESTRKHTLVIYDRLVEAIQACWEADADLEKGQTQISDILFEYHKSEGKEAIKMILEADMDIFKDKKKHFRIYAQSILEGGKGLAKARIKDNDKAVARLIANSEKMAADLAKPETAHAMGTGMKRIENEIRHRPMFMMEDIKFRFLRTIGVY